MSGHEGPPSVDLKAVAKIVTGLIVVCAVVVLLDFTYEKHGHPGFLQIGSHGILDIPGFHAAYGFVSCVLLVLAATQLRKLVMRGEDYYDD